MKVNGLEFDFGRVMEVAFEKNGAVVSRICHNPQYDKALCGRIEAEVTDMPSAHKDDQPGFSAKITIYNPSRELLTLIASNSKWMTDYARIEPGMSAAEKTKELDRVKNDYDNNRLKCSVYAGYFKADRPSYMGDKLINGYVNGSSFVMRGRDEVLIVEVHDINFISTSDKVSFASSTLLKSDDFELEWKKESDEKRKGARTFDSTFKKYVRLFQPDRLNGSTAVINVPGVEQPQKAENPAMTRIVSDADRTTTTWFKVLYVQSREAFMRAIINAPYTESSPSINKVLYPKLEALCKDPEVKNGMDYKNFYTTADNIDGMLTELCRAAPVRVTWDRVWDNVSVLTFIVYPIGRDKNFVPGDKAAIKIWNYQNLLSAPSIDGSGMMTIKMLYNPVCTTRVTIALMLSSTLGRGNNVAPVSFRAGDRLLGTAESTAANAVYSATNQITGTQVVESLRRDLAKKGEADADLRGYMFNTGFPIIRVIHKLSTHSNDWSTTVRTVPMINGLNYGAKNDKSA